jgi:hypothetical protein
MSTVHCSIETAEKMSSVSSERAEGIQEEDDAPPSGVEVISMTVLAQFPILFSPLLNILSSPSGRSPRL